MKRRGPFLRTARQGDAEQQASPVAVLHGDVPAVEGHGVFHDGEPKSRSARTAGPPFVDAVETLEEAGQVLRGNSRPVVADGEDNLSVGGGDEVQTDTGAAAVGDGVVDEVAEDGFQQGGVALRHRERREGGDVVFEGDVPAESDGGFLRYSLGE